MRDIPGQSQAMIELIERGRSFDVADIAMVEMLFVLDRYYGFSRADIERVILDLAGNPKLNFNRILFERVGELFIKHSGWSIEDCCLLIYADLNQATPLWTFDQKLAKQSNDKAQLVNV